MLKVFTTFTTYTTYREALFNGFGCTFPQNNYEISPLQIALLPSKNLVRIFKDSIFFFTIIGIHLSDM